jgi:hypothetical protein
MQYATNIETKGIASVSIYHMAISWVFHAAGWVPLFTWIVKQ